MGESRWDPLQVLQGGGTVKVVEHAAGGEGADGQEEVHEPSNHVESPVALAKQRQQAGADHAGRLVGGEGGLARVLPGAKLAEVLNRDGTRDPIH